MIKIYSFKESNKKQYEEWNEQVSYDHPIIQDFKENNRVYEICWSTREIPEQQP